MSVSVSVLSSVIVPAEIAAQQFLGQTSTLSAVTIFTPSVDTLVRVTLYISTSDTDPGDHATQSILSWTDEIGVAHSNASFDFAACFSHTGSGGGPDSNAVDIVFKAKGGQPISISTGTGGHAALASPYNLYITVEGL